MIIPHDSDWCDIFETEKRNIYNVTGGALMQVHHIGSTAVPDIWAKPVIDIMGVTESFAYFDAVGNRLCFVGYLALGENGISGRRFFQKITAPTINACHLHIFERGSPHIERHLAFRDYLLVHPKIAAEYSELKTSIVRDGVSSRQEYQDRKSPFIMKTEAAALIYYRQRNMGKQA